MSIIKSILLISLFASLAFGQEFCPNDLTQEEKQIVISNIDSGLYNSGFDISNRGVTNKIRVKWHVVGNTHGNIAIDSATLSYYIDELNSAFSPMNIEFVADPVTHWIIDDDLYESVDSTYNLRQMSTLEGAMNVYWAPMLGDGGLCGQSSFSFQFDQGIVMQTSCSGETDIHSVFIHEVGHYFDLFHTHEFECPEALNCEIEGDYVCDTPPSPRLWFDACVNPNTCQLWDNVSSECNTTGVIWCNESQYDVGINTINYMSYAPISCMSMFTTGQVLRAVSTYINLRRDHHDPILPQCKGDLNGDGTINSGDMGLLLSGWGELEMDLNGDAKTDGADLALILSNWGSCWD